MEGISEYKGIIFQHGYGQGEIKYYPPFGQIKESLVFFDLGIRLYWGFSISCFKRRFRRINGKYIAFSFLELERVR